MALPALASCGLRQAGSEATSTPPQVPLSAADIGFINQATAAGVAELQEAQLATERARRPAVKQFARQMIADHASLDQQLSALAQHKGVAVAAEADAAATPEIRELEAARRGFDALYVRDQLAAQDQAVALFRQAGEQGTDPGIRAFAQQNLPLVQQHLAMVEALDGRSVTDRM